MVVPLLLQVNGLFYHNRLNCITISIVIIYKISKNYFLLYNTYLLHNEEATVKYPFNLTVASF